MKADAAAAPNTRFSLHTPIVCWGFSMAATDGGRCIRNAPYRLTFALRNSNGNAATSWSPSNIPASALSSDFASETTGAVPVEIGSATGLGYLDLTVAQMTFAYQLMVHIDAGSNVVPTYIELKGEPCIDSGVAVSAPTNASIKLRAATTLTTNSICNGATIEIVRGTGRGQVRTITAYAASSQTATVDRDWITNPSTDSVYIIHPRIASAHATVGNPDVNVTSLQGETTALTVMTELYNGAIKSSVASGTPSTVTFTGASGLSTTADFYNRCFLVFTTGDLQGLMRPIGDYSAARLITFDATDAWPEAPEVGDEFVILSYRS